MTRDRARALRDSGGMSPAISRQASGAARTRQSEVLRLQGLAGNSAVTGMLALQRDAATVTPDSPASTKANPDPLAVVAAAFPTAMAIAGQLEPILRLAGADLAPLAIGALVANGFRDESKLTDVAFWLHHPELSGEALKPGLPGYPSLAKDWIDLRTSVVRPALEVRDASPQVVQSHPAPGEAQPAATSGSDDFVKDWARSTLELLPRSQREKFESIEWGPLDFPGTTVAIKGLKADALDWYLKQPNVVQKDGKEGPYLTSSNQDAAKALFLALSQVRPGGGERRVNINDSAVIPEEAFRSDPTEFYDYVTSQLEGIPGQTDIQMNSEAATKFAEMRGAAKAEGVPLVALNAFRPLAHEMKAEKAAGNRNAVGGISHLIGLAVDVKLHIDKKHDPDFVETGTGNFNKMLNMLESPVYKWIFMNGSRFGFYQYRQEPWHWEYNPEGFRDRFYAGAPNLKEKTEAVLEAARPKKRKK